MSEGGLVPVPSLPAVGAFFKLFGWKDELPSGYKSTAQRVDEANAAVAARFSAAIDAARAAGRETVTAAELGYGQEYARDYTYPVAAIAARVGELAGTMRGTEWYRAQPPAGGTAPEGSWSPSPSLAALANPFAQALPGRTPDPVPRAPGAPPERTWRDNLELAGRLVIELWQRVYDAQAARDAQRRAQRALQAAFDRYFRSIAIQVPAARVPPSGGSVMDLLQLSAGGTGRASLFGPSEFGGGGWGGLVAGLGSAAGSVIRALSGEQESVLAPYGDPWGPNILYPQSERAGAALQAAFAGGCGSPFVAGGSALRPSTFSMANPATGKTTWFRPAGRPVLWSSDFAACRRVRKVASKARRRTGGR